MGTAFENFIQLEFPKRPVAATDATPETILVRKDSGKPRNYEALSIPDGKVLGSVGGTLTAVDPGGSASLDAEFTSFTFVSDPGNQEIGTTYNPGTIDFQWTIFQAGGLTDNTVSISSSTQGSLATGLSLTSPATVSVSSFTFNDTHTETFTITADKAAGGTISKTVTLKWVWPTFSGTSATDTPDSSLLNTLTKTLVGDKIGQFTLAPTGAQYGYIAYNSAYGTVSSIKTNDGFSLAVNDMSPVSTTVNGQTTNYNVYRTYYLQNGTLIVDIE